LCLTTTFEALARKGGLPVLQLSCRSQATLDRTAAGLAFTALSLHVEVEVMHGDEERAATLVASAKKHCLVANALALPVTLDLVVTTPAVAGAR
jgi:organic hydroperoxide reductase OsmC/OhrA